MKVWPITIILSFLISCTGHHTCRFSTVLDLDNMDLRVCSPAATLRHDSLYFYRIREFSGGFDKVRSEKGIPGLPKDFEVMTWSVDNQVRWRNAPIYRKIADDPKFRQAHMERKDLEWNGDTLIYDRSNFTAMDSMETWIYIWYVHNSITGGYVFQCGYSNKTMIPGSDVTITKSVADSMLKVWGIHN